MSDKISKRNILNNKTPIFIAIPIKNLTVGINIKINSDYPSD